MKKIFLFLFFIFNISCQNSLNIRNEKYNFIGSFNPEVKWRDSLESKNNKNLEYIYNELNSKMVKDFWKHMSSVYGSEIIYKNDSSFMSFVGGFLSFFGLMKKEVFLNDYATTINKKIYIPFTIGDTTNKTDLLNELILCVHEHEHIAQYIKHKGKFSVGYLLNHKKRANFEMKAYTTAIEIYFWFFKEILNTQFLADKLINYNCTKKDISSVKKKLDKRVLLIKEGKVLSDAGKIAIVWLNENAKNLQVKN